MENTSLNTKENGEVNYHGNKDIKLKKRGRPPKKKESPPEVLKTPLEEKPISTPVYSEKEKWEKWIRDNRKEFFNSGKKDRQFILDVYKAYNVIFNSNKSPGKCGICDWNIILDLKQRYF
jgi:hypothetical protein